jgi:hypothetical protein
MALISEIPADTMGGSQIAVDLPTGGALVSHRSWPPSFRKRTSALFMMSVAATGYRRWLSRPWQWTLKDFMILVAVCAAGLVLSGFPTPMIVFFSILAGAILVSLSLARHGFRLTDIATLLAFILLTAAMMLPAMERTRDHTLGKRFFPFAVPARYITLLYGSD